MSALRQTVESFAAFTGRGAGTDAERRAAAWIAAELRRSGREAALETFWCRPNWALAHAWHVGLGVAGSLVAVGSPKAGAAMILAALLFVIVDWAFGASPGRRLTPERASQNVVSAPPRQRGEDRIRLVVTANLDAGRRGLAYRPPVRGPFNAARQITGGRAPGWLGWLTLALGWALATAVARIDGSHGTAISVAQLIPTVALVIALALLLEMASADWSTGASDNASGAAVAVALVRALDAAPPAAADVELVLTGAGDSQGIGLRRYLRARRGARRAHNTVVLGIAACGAGHPVYLRSDGPLIPLAYFGVLRRLAADAALADAGLGLHEARSRGTSPALPARLAGLPSIAIAALDANGLAPRTHTAQDGPDLIDDQALDATLRAALLLADAVDAYLVDLPLRASQTFTPA